MKKPMTYGQYKKYLHGKGGQEACISADSDALCEGLICECEGETPKNHGTATDPCQEANCYHCGWGGRFPNGLTKCPKCRGSGFVEAEEEKDREPARRGPLKKRSEN